MLAKPVNLMLVYIVTIFNLVVLASPVLAALIPFLEFRSDAIIIDNELKDKVSYGILFLLFLISFLMLFYLFLDFLFGFSYRSSLKNCTPYQKIKDYEFLTEIFNQAKDKFGQRGVKLYIKNSDEINAFAVSSVGGKAVVLTRGLINHYLVECQDPQMFLYALRSVIGHEMSHLINKDFLPTFLIIVNQKITNFISSLLFISLSILVKMLNYIPYGGRASARGISESYTILNFIITAFNRFVVFNVYQFVRYFISRSIEYRCDKQSAKAFGGQNMALALSMLGDNGYFTLFSSHPRTKKRIKKVEKVESATGKIRPGFFDSLSNFFSIFFLMFCCLCFAKQASVDVIVREYVKDHEAIHQKLSLLWQLVTKFF